MRRTLAAVTLAVLAFPAGVARAQSKDDVARADSLFNAGKALSDAGQFADACPKFAESKRLAPGLGVTLYLANCYEQIGHTASAWTEFRSAEGLARERNDKRAELARARAQALEPTLNRLTIAVAATVPLSGLQLLRDGSPVGQDELGLPVPVDPGDHVVVVSAPGHKARSFKARVNAETPSATVHIDGLDEDVATAPPISTAIPATTTAIPMLPSTPSLPSSSTSNGSATRRWIGLGVGGLGLAGVGVGSVLGMMAKSKLDQSNNGWCDSTNHCDLPGLSLRKDAEGLALGSTIAFITGGAAVATGVVLFVTAPRAGSSTGVLVAPVPLAGGGGAMVRASF
jgi:serine/threonine-protein kinase